MKRTIFTILLFLAVFFLPWWAFVFCGLLVCLQFKKYYEIVGLCFIYDMVYSYPDASWMHNQFSLTIVVFLLVVLIEEGKLELRLHSK